MKCDELTPIDLEINLGKDSVTGQVNREPWKAYDIDEVNAAIAELKTALKESEEARYEAGADAADYYQENRKLKRALWLARAERADDRARIFYFAETCGIKLNIDGFSIKEKGKTRMCTARFWTLTWLKVERKCQTKAEEYK